MLVCSGWREGARMQGGGVVGSGSASRTSAMKAKRHRQTALKPRSEVWRLSKKHEETQSAGKILSMDFDSFQNWLAPCCTVLWSVTQSCPTLATPRTVAHQAPLSMGILQARRLEWVAMPSSRGSSQTRD